MNKKETGESDSGDTRGGVAPTFPKPLNVLLILLVTIFSTEGIIMVAFEFMPELPLWVEVVSDATLITVITFPLIFIFVYRPLIEHINVHKTIAVDLRRAKEVAESATQLKDKFVSLVAHDLRSPFNAILGLLKILRNDNTNPLNENQVKIIDRVVDSSESLLQMIEELLSLNRIQSGVVAIVPRFLDARVLADQVMNAESSSANMKKVTILNSVPDGILLNADYDLLFEVMRNIIGNAIKFCSSGDTITIFSPSETASTLAVRDTGQGIDEAIVPDLFKAEIKTSHTGTLGEKGTGLGLPLCLDIVKAHGGELRVTSTLGEGAVFYVTLPHKTPRALWVGRTDCDCEDQVVDILHTFNIEVTDVENSDSAFILSSEYIFHLLVTCNQNSYRELMALREKEISLRQIPMIYIDPDLEDEAGEPGSTGTVMRLSQPVDPDKLKTMVSYNLFANQ